MAPSRLRVGVLGAGAWAQHAHIPGWQRDPRCQVVAICDVGADRARDFAQKFGIPDATDDWQATVARPESTWWTSDAFAHALRAPWPRFEAGKHVLCEKPVAYDYRQTRGRGARGEKD